MPQVCGTMRGTNCTGGIVALRGGASGASRPPSASTSTMTAGAGPWARPSPTSARWSTSNKFGRDLPPIPGRPGHPPAAARLHGRDAAEPEQPRHRRSRRPPTTGQHAAGDLLRDPRVHHAGRRLRPRVLPARVPAARRGRPPITTWPTTGTSRTRAWATPSAAGTISPARTSWVSTRRPPSSTPSSVPGTTRASASSAAAACRPSAPPTSPTPSPRSASGPPRRS